MVKVMWELTYCNPDGEESRPEPEKLCAIISEEGPDYYANSGAASLYGTARDQRGVVVYSAHNTPLLCWFLEEPYGFHFSFNPPKGTRQLTYDGSEPQPRVEHYMGGELTYLPVGCFVSRDLAWEVVQEFLRSQRPSPAVQWISSLEFEALGIDHNRPD
jgi:Immunity protein Imm1